MQGDVEDELEVQIDRIKRRQVGEAVERFAGSLFCGVDKRDDFVHECLVPGPSAVSKA
jgi:hypothetical protein